MKSIAEWYIRSVRHRGKRHTVRWLMRTLPFYSLRSFYGPVLRCNPKDNTNVYCISGEYGHFITDHLDRALKPSDVFLDIGTNCGLFSLYAAQKLTTGLVCSFEPNPNIYGYFLDNIRLNKIRNILPFHCAVGPEEKIIHLSFSETHSGKSAVSNMLSDISVPQFDISRWEILNEASKGKDIHIKIDVEGFEQRILETLQKAVWNERVKSIIVEIDEENLQQFGSNAERIYAIMAAQGFSPTIGLKNGAHYDEIFSRAR